MISYFLLWLEALKMSGPHTEWQAAKMYGFIPDAGLKSGWHLHTTDFFKFDNHGPIWLERVPAEKMKKPSLIFMSSRSCISDALGKAGT